MNNKTPKENLGGEVIDSETNTRGPEEVIKDFMNGNFTSKKRQKINAQKKVKRNTKRNWIAYSPDLAEITGSVNAGLFLSQLLYWDGKGKDPEEFYKTIKEMKEETGLTKSEQYTAQKKCEDKNLIEVSYKQIPPKRHFKINVEKIQKLLKSFNS